MILTTYNSRHKCTSGIHAAAAAAAAIQPPKATATAAAATTAATTAAATTVPVLWRDRNIERQDQPLEFEAAALPLPVHTLETLNPKP